MGEFDLRLVNAVLNAVGSSSFTMSREDVEERRKRKTQMGKARKRGKGSEVSWTYGRGLKVVR